MICPACREAGTLIKIITGSEHSAEVQDAWVYLEQQAIMLHKECRGGTWCDCQHITTGNGVNPYASYG